MVSRRFTLECPWWGFASIILGRAAALRCTSAVGKRLDQMSHRRMLYGQAVDPVRQLRRVRRWVRSGALRATIVAGDVNFVGAAEGHLNVDAGRAEFTDEVTMAEFERLLFSKFADVIPHRFTRAQPRVGAGVRRVALLTRIGRCWASLSNPVADIAGLSNPTTSLTYSEAGAEGHAVWEHPSGGGGDRASLGAGISAERGGLLERAAPAFEPHSASRSACRTRA